MEDFLSLLSFIRHALTFVIIGFYHPTRRFIKQGISFFFRSMDLLESVMTIFEFGFVNSWKTNEPNHVKLGELGRERKKRIQAKNARDAFAAIQ